MLRTVSRTPIRIASLLPVLTPELETDSVARTNAHIFRLLSERSDRYQVVPIEEAQLVVSGELQPESVSGPPRLIFAHGALGDPGHWLLTLPELRACDCLALGSSSDRAIFDKLAGTVRCRTAWLPLFVDTQFFAPRPALRAEARARLQIAQDAPLVMAASALAAQKNVQSVLLWLRELLRARGDVRCVIAGSGKAEQTRYLQGLAERLGVAHAVRFIGKQTQTEMAALYNAADLFVHLTLNRKENLGLVSLEAQACGVPVLAGRWGGVRDTLLEGETGFFAESYLVGGEWRADWLALVPHALRLLEDRAQHQRFSSAGRAFVEREFSLPAFASRLDRQIDGLLAEPVADRRRLQLSEAAQSLVVVFALRAVEHPELEDSRDVSETLREPYDGEHVYRIIHECMASSAPPLSREADTLVYRLLDAVLDTKADVIEVLDRAWAAHLSLTAPQAWVWSTLEETRTWATLQRLAAASGLTADALESGFRELLLRGLIGATPGFVLAGA